MAANLRLLYRSCSGILGNLSNIDSDGQENVVKRHLKSDVALLQKLYRAQSFHLVQFVKCWQFFLELNFKRLYQSSGKEKESGCLVFKSSEKREIRYFHVVVVQ